MAAAAAADWSDTIWTRTRLAVVVLAGRLRCGAGGGVIESCRAIVPGV